MRHALRLLLTVFGLVLAFLAVEALSQAGAEARAETRASHANSRTQSARPGRSAASHRAPVTPTARAIRTRKVPHRVARPRIATRRPIRPSGRLLATALPYDHGGHTGHHHACATRDRPTGTAPTRRASVPVERAVPHSVRREPSPPRLARPVRPATRPYRIESTGPVTSTPRPPSPQVGVPPPVPAPVSGCGDGGCGGGKTSGGTGEVLRVDRPASGLWTTTLRTWRRPGRHVPDKPPFSPD
ncbi:hypothetical protein [Actinoallomurus iriomotensis]|uniref:hypothetical protein n=1 Tax=Actinoallomurus iriomotensis TaxID=478107 RepID=UPI0025528D8C|nr:hypothetical protein [Actinoallomurus iriomotensis]